MRAALLTELHAPVAVETVPSPDCPADGVIVEVRACGVCRSDLHTVNGSDPTIALPHVMGHEFAGVVADVGPQCHSFSVGDRVTAPFVLGCGRCADCLAGSPTACNQQRLIGFSQWGAFAEQLAVQHADFNVVRLPEGVDFVEAAGLGCRVTTAWRGIHDRAALQEGEWLAVHGCGGVGLSAIMLARVLGARVIAIDVSDAALDKARELGAEHTINPRRHSDVGNAVRAATDGGAHVSVDAMGISSTFDNSLRSLRTLGRHVQIGMPTGEHATVMLPLLELVYSRQLSLFGMRGLGATGFSDLLALAANGALDLSQLVTQRLSLDEVQDVLERLQAGTLTGIAVVDRF
ncbi:MAG: alcohol dehydrogenase catalytic domain-containing protein [Actinomycetales bacterium]|nr:alcohol dehydrogenase catalytic domain-containing protein [Actinomycetales bacterium]